MGSTTTMFGTSVVVSSGVNGTPNFIPLTPWIDASEVLKVRATLEMRGNSGSCQINGAYQTTNDKVTLNTPASILTSPSYLTAEGFQYPLTNGFRDLSSTTDDVLYIRFGVQVQPTSSGGIQGCLASIKVDIQGP